MRAPLSWLRDHVRTDVSPGEIARRLDTRFPPMEHWLALRVAYLDRLVGMAVDRLNVRQVVILGAGESIRVAAAS